MTNDYFDDDDHDHHVVNFIPINLRDCSAQWSSPVYRPSLHPYRPDCFVIEQTNPYYEFTKSPEHKWLIDNFKTYRTEENSSKYLFGTIGYPRHAVWFTDKSYAYMFYMKFCNGS